jgi:catechol 2,3-dioxygenase-like lactoylglutathione lyase family enzyme
MGLRGATVRASIAVSDLPRADAFYRHSLKLVAGEDQPDESRIYECGGGSALHVYVSPDNAGKAPGTLATWYVDRLEDVVDELSAGGVTFERYDEPVKTDAKGIHRAPGITVAWIKDPDGNVFAIEERA